MNLDLTPEQLQKAKEAKSAEELLALAKEAGLELTAGQAQAYFDRLQPSGELADDELDNVSGGCAPLGNPSQPPVPGDYSCQYFYPEYGSEAGCSNCRYSQYAGGGMYYCTHMSNFKS